MEAAGEEHRAALSPDIRAIKERLFAPTATESERLDYELPNRFLISIARQDFLKSKEWKAIEKQLRQEQAKCFDQADRS